MLQNSCISNHLGSGIGAAHHTSKITSTKHMYMEMRHLLVPIIAMVSQQSIACFDDMRIAGHLSNSPEKLGYLGITGIY